MKFEFATWFKLDDPNTGYDNCFIDPIGTIEAHFGVVRTDRSQKPAYDDVKRQFGQF